MNRGSKYLENSHIYILYFFSIKNKPGVGGKVAETNQKTQVKPQWIVAQRLLSHLQSLDPSKSSAKDLSLPTLEIKIHPSLFSENRAHTQKGRDLMLV